MWDDRSLFLDEANVALNISERSWLNLLGNLDYGQHFPPLPLLAIKGLVNCLGNTSFSLRLVSLVVGILSLWVFYLASRKWLIHSWFPLYFMGFSMFVVRYQTELKQYSIDGLMSVLFIYFLINARPNVGRHWWLLGLFVVLGLWSSMPMVFLIVGLGVYSMPLWRVHYKPLLLIAGLSLASFMVLYLVNLGPSIASDHLQNFHKHHFFQWSFSIDAWLHNFKLFEHFIGAWLGSKTVTIVSVFLLMLLGFYRLFRIDVWALYAVLAVFFSTSLVSGFHMYSMIPRLLFFWIPLVLILMALGFDQCWVFLKNRGINKVMAWCLLSLLFVLPNVVYRSAVPSFWKAFSIEEPRDVLLEMKAKIQAQDVIYVTKFGRPAFKYYTQYHRDAIPLANEIIYTEDYRLGIREAMIYRESLEGAIWLFDSHIFEEEATLNKNLNGASSVLKAKHTFAAKYN